MNIGLYSFDEYVHLVKSFHGHAAPGMIIGGIMVDTALKNRPPGEFFDALCETANCLPDAIQLLTPCTVGNGWLQVVDLGRFAITLYEKYGGEGIRVYLDSSTLDDWPAIKGWFFRLKPKSERDLQALVEQAGEAGPHICRIQRVQVHPRFMEREPRGSIVLCPRCGEAYPSKDGGICLGCKGENPYTDIGAPRSAAAKK